MEIGMVTAKTSTSTGEMASIITKRAHHGDGAGRNLQQVVGQGGVDRVDVVGDAADDVAGLVAVKIAHRQSGSLSKKSFRIWKTTFWLSLIIRTEST